MPNLFAQSLMVADLHPIIHSVLEEQDWIPADKVEGLCELLRRRITLHQSGEVNLREGPLVITNVADGQADLDVERNSG